MPRWFRIYVGVAAGLMYLEVAIGLTLSIHLPSPPEPWFVKPPGIIIHYPHPTYEKDEWWNTWNQYDV
jgi:hypothetical protein